jgi:nucleolar protein 56
MYLVTKWFGTFLCNETGIKRYILFPKDEKKIAERLLMISQEKILSEEKELSKKKDVVVFEKRLQEIGKYLPDDDFLKSFILKPEEYGFNFDLLKKASLIVSQENASKKLSSPDFQIVQMIKTLDDFIQTSNLLLERLDSWYDFCPPDYRIDPLKNTYEKVNAEIINLQNQIEKEMCIVAPNISSIVGPIIGARLISYAGNLKLLAMLPSSTIQILGAEKALFRFKKQGSLPPKHGIIFQHPLINKSSRSERGKIARVLSAKISTAAKADAFTKRDLSKNLKEELDTRIKEIKNLLKNKSNL